MIENTFPYTDPTNADLTANIVSNEDGDIVIEWHNLKVEFGPLCGRIRCTLSNKTLDFTEFSLSSSVSGEGVLTRFVEWANDNLLSDEVTKLSVTSLAPAVVSTLKKAKWSKRGNTYTLKKTNA